MNGLPPWVNAALDIVQGNVDEDSSPLWSSDLRPLIQEKAVKAGFTCDKCPCPWRPPRYYDKSLILDEDTTGGWSIAEDTPRNYTLRCPECARKMKRWQRGKRAIEQVQMGSLLYEKQCSFVTLTCENFKDPHDGVRTLKRRIASFRKRFPLDCIAGGYDFFEWTQSKDGKYNVHHHGIWIMDYWNQKDMQDSWSHGIVHLKRIQGQRGKASMIRYAMKYAGKEQVKGIRLKQSFGCLYGRARHALETVYAQLHPEES